NIIHFFFLFTVNFQQIFLHTKLHTELQISIYQSSKTLNFFFFFRFFFCFSCFLFLTTDQGKIINIRPKKRKRKRKKKTLQKGTTTSLQAKSSEFLMESSGHESRRSFSSSWAFRFALSVQSL
ncbi:hypothetical protein PanWU01x14_081480, partial [Parasponia andersonii]